MTTFPTHMHCCTNPYSPHEQTKRWIAPDVNSDSVSKSLEILQREDPSARSKLLALKKRAIAGRIRAKHVEKREISFPIDHLRYERPLTPNEVPMLVGLKCSDHREKRTGGDRQYRVYFGDVSDTPNEPQERMVATRFFQSQGAVSDLKKNCAQDDAIKSAMTGLIWWCDQQIPRVSYRTHGLWELRK